MDNAVECRNRKTVEIWDGEREAEKNDSIEADQISKSNPFNGIRGSKETEHKAHVYTFRKYRFEVASVVNVGMFFYFLSNYIYLWFLCFVILNLNNSQVCFFFEKWIGTIFHYLQTYNAAIEWF